jgi:hypothetical protein
LKDHSWPSSTAPSKRRARLYFIDFISQHRRRRHEDDLPDRHHRPQRRHPRQDRHDLSRRDGAFRTYIGGFADTSEYTVPFILYKGDAGHQALFSLHESGDVVGWFCGFSDSTDAPTIGHDQDNLVAPNDRTGFSFRGYVANLTIDLATNEVVRGTLTIQPRTAPVPHWAS